MKRAAVRTKMIVDVVVTTLGLGTGTIHEDRMAAAVEAVEVAERENFRKVEACREDEILRERLKRKMLEMRLDAPPMPTEMEEAVARLRIKREDHPECTGPGKCHGSLKWCGWCGDMANICDDPGKCSCHPSVGMANADYPPPPEGMEVVDGWREVERQWNPIEGNPGLYTARLVRERTLKAKGEIIDLRGQPPTKEVFDAAYSAITRQSVGLSNIQNIPIKIVLDSEAQFAFSREWDPGPKEKK